jgi:cytochrome P450
LSIEEIVDHIFTFIFLGYENMVSTILWIFYELCRHPDIQRQCSEEVDRIMTVQGMHTSVVLFDDIPRFKHLIEVLKETLRLHPPIPAITGNCQAPCKLGKFYLKKGTKIHISLLALHKHPNFWYLPDEFLPDRFSPENAFDSMKSPFQYIPFGGGSRNCIGQRFGQMAILVVVAVLLSKFSFSMLDEDYQTMKIEEKYVMRPTNMKIRIKLRHRNSDHDNNNNNNPLTRISTAKHE